MSRIPRSKSVLFRMTGDDACILSEHLGGCTAFAEENDWLIYGLLMIGRRSAESSRRKTMSSFPHLSLSQGVRWSCNAVDATVSAKSRQSGPVMNGRVVANKVPGILAESNLLDNSWLKGTVFVISCESGCLRTAMNLYVRCSRSESAPMHPAPSLTCCKAAHKSVMSSMTLVFVVVWHLSLCPEVERGVGSKQDRSMCAHCTLLRCFFAGGPILRWQSADRNGL